MIFEQSGDDCLAAMAVASFDGDEALAGGCLSIPLYTPECRWPMYDAPCAVVPGLQIEDIDWRAPNPGWPPAKIKCDLVAYIDFTETPEARRLREAGEAAARAFRLPR